METTPRSDRSLQGAHQAIEAIVLEVASLLTVAAIDVQDVYDDDTLIGTFSVEEPGVHGSHRDLPIARRFAQELVTRILYSDEIVLDWVPAPTDETQTYGDLS
ncbi:MAG: hypothetical protein K0S70_4724 [Microbacterium sp.]|jgi:hypothetical protein|nr:hypothetical protein [Microbacterium sp.]